MVSERGKIGLDRQEGRGLGDRIRGDRMKRRRWMLAATGGMLGLLLVWCGLGLWRIGEVFLTSGIEVFLGQVRLTRQSGPLPARAYVSNELLLGGVHRSEVVEASLILLPEEVYFWDPFYIGFERAELADEETDQLLGTLTSGNLFASSYGLPILCAWRIGEAEAKLTACEEGPQWQAIHEETRLAAELEPGMGVLQFHLGDGRLAEYALYSANGLLAYSAVEVNEVAVEGYLAAAGEAMQSIAARAVVEPIGVIWPEQSADEANAHAARLLGRYIGALEFLGGLEPLHLTLGRIREIRPAEGGNWSSTWLDSSSVQLLLRVTGDNGEAAVMVEGGECWDAEMMYRGKLIDLTSGAVCPEG